MSQEGRKHKLTTMGLILVQSRLVDDSHAGKCQVPGDSLQAKVERASRWLLQKVFDCITKHQRKVKEHIRNKAVIKVEVE